MLTQKIIQKVHLISYIFYFKLVRELFAHPVESFVLIELSPSADFRFSVAERGREFSSVVSRKFYNTFVLVRDSGLCLFAEKSLQRINQNLAETNCIKATGS